MKIADTISVNPGKTALGHVESAPSIFRNRILGVEKSSVSVDLLKVVFPSAKAGTSEFRKYAVPMRTLFATILIVTGLTILTSTFSVYTAGFAICSICFGGCLALGLFTRPVMFGAAVYYCVMGALSIRSGAADISVFGLMFGTLIFGLMGAGKYSCDTLLLSALLHQQRAAKARKQENMMSYKAFHHVKF